jgi:hypothetical protein
MKMMNMAQKLKELLTPTIRVEESKLRATPEAMAATRGGAGEGWSRKQELGHLIDSGSK